jgi:hypothetical protein
MAVLRESRTESGLLLRVLTARPGLYLRSQRGLTCTSSDSRGAGMRAEIDIFARLTLVAGFSTVV